MNDVLLSIICPAYNAEKTIGKLIESLENQEYKDYEFIILNDGSTDNTLKEIKKYSKKYSNIIMIDKPNTGVGDTRNRGLEIAKGKYITFADSDDWYSDDFFDVIIPEIKKEDFEMLVFNAHVMNFDKKIGNEISSKYKEGYFKEKDGVKKYLQGEFCYKLGNVPWNKIYVNEIIKTNNLKFEENKKRGQDLLFNILYVSKIKKYRYVNKNLYNYALNMDTLTIDKYIKIEIEEILKYYKPLEKICVDNKINNCQQYIGLFFLRRFPGIVLNETNNDDYKIGKENITNFLKNSNMYKTFKSIRIKNFDYKLFICYVFYKLKIYKLFYNIVWKRKYKNSSKK